MMMTGRTIAVRSIASGSILDIEADRPVVLFADIFEEDRKHAIYGFRNEFPTRVDARAWRAVAPSMPAYVADLDAFTPEDGHQWILCEIPDALGLGSVPSLPLDSTIDLDPTFGEVSFLYAEDDS